MKIKLFLCSLLLLVILIMLVFNSSIKNLITEKLFKQLPDYSCNTGGLCMKCYKDGRGC